MLLWLWLASLSLQMYLPMLETCSNSEFTSQSLSLVDAAQTVENSRRMAFDGMGCTLYLGHSVSFNFAVSAEALTRHQAPHVK